MADKYEEGLNQIERLMRDPITYFWPNHYLSPGEHRRMSKIINDKSYRQIGYEEGASYMTVRNTVTEGRKKLSYTATEIRIMMMEELRRIVDELIQPS